jgi:hypothetical protein
MFANPVAARLFPRGSAPAQTDCGGKFAATGVAEPMMPDFAAIDKFRGLRRHHAVAAIRASGSGGNIASESSGVVACLMDLHGLVLLSLAGPSTLSS